MKYKLLTILLFIISGFFFTNNVLAVVQTKTHICKTDAISLVVGVPVCTDGSWCDTASFSSVSPSSCAYTVLAGDVAGSPHDYYVFVCDESNICSASTHGTWSANTPPIVNNLAVSDIGSSACSIPSYNFSWVFNDSGGDTQSQYQLQVGGVDITTITNSQSKEILLAKNPGLDQLSYNQNYSWRVRVWDNNGSVSAWVNGNNFTTPVHIYPTPDFSWSPLSIIKDRLTQFLSDASKCYDASNNVISCLGSVFTWTLPINAEFANSTNASTPNPVIKFKDSGKNQAVSLQIQDNVGACSVSKNVNVALPLPKWKEILPQ